MTNHRQQYQNLTKRHRDVEKYFQLILKIKIKLFKLDYSKCSGYKNLIKYTLMRSI